MKLNDVSFYTDDFRRLKTLVDIMEALTSGTVFYMNGYLENGKGVSTSSVTSLMANAAGLVVTTQSGSIYIVTLKK